MSRPFDAQRFGALSEKLTLGRPLVATLATGSTNDDALAAARDGAPHGALFVTEEQSRGRGRRGSRWLAARGEGLLFSLVLRPTLSAERAPLLALLTGLAVRDVVSALLVSASVNRAALVKWPNDVVIAGDELEKLAGILVESQVRGSALASAVVGVGLNVGRLELPGDLRPTPTSLARLGISVEREELLAKILERIEARLRALENHAAPFDVLAAELSAVDALRGRNLRVENLCGRGAGIDAGGYLCIMDEARVTHRVGSGHVELLERFGGQGHRERRTGPETEPPLRK
ncbi:MAG TPA: biotin--[acetyl-CoA-carboxylase] ligase [Polyangiaceae bacterium]|nr:biotin--[acetyl-CoA-carboxylase] ligase [Polyangiaceae bacterium]